MGEFTFSNQSMNTFCQIRIPVLSPKGNQLDDAPFFQVLDQLYIAECVY